MTGQVVCVSSLVQGARDGRNRRRTDPAEGMVIRAAQREFLFLQGLAGPFFAHLGVALARSGHGVNRVNFNGGDKVYWRGPGAVDFRGSLRRWPRFLGALLEARAITDLVLFGDCRPLHGAAIGLARARGVQVHVFEEGYIRPDFVTLEVDGVNGHSRLPRDPEDYLAAAQRLPPLPTLPAIASSFARRAREDLIYNLSSVLMMPLFPGYRTHRPWNILHEYAGWGVRLLRQPGERRRSAATLDRLAASGRPYFVFPLQLDCDYQIRVHSRFEGVRPAIELVLRSFARNAPPDTLLVVKGHPLDNGLHDWGKRTMAAARAAGIADRVLFLETADIDLLVRPARGLVTVNSTTGTLSLRHGVPTLVLGDAVYDIPRITDQDGLDLFWTHPTPPEMEVFDAFRRVLIDRCLIHGGYFSDDGIDRLVAGAITRLEAVATPMTVVRLASPTQPVSTSTYAAQG